VKNRRSALLRHLRTQALQAIAFEHAVGRQKQCFFVSFDRASRITGALQ
jgi:hypothetical protein